jgi:hypothetical protein
MSDSRNPAVSPAPPVGNAAPVQPVRGQQPVGLAAERSIAPRGHEVAAVTGGSLSPAYAQFMVDQDTHDVVIRIHDAATNQVIAQYPSAQIEAMAADMQKYADTIARHRAALTTPGKSR